MKNYYKMKIKQFYFFRISLAIFVLLSCSNTIQKSKTPLASDEEYLAVLSTDYGDIEIILYHQTPKHKANFIKLIKEGFYDSLLFHRVIQGFMIQGGDPNSKNAKKGKRLGDGNPGYKIDAEFVDTLFHQRGALAAARMGDAVNPQRKSNGSQFYLVQGKKYVRQELLDSKVKHRHLNYLFSKLLKDENFSDLKIKYSFLQEEGDKVAIQRCIFDSKELIEKHFKIELDNPISETAINIYTTLGGSPKLDGEYTVFGQTVLGFEVIDKITKLKVDAAKRPIEDVKMKWSLRKIKKKEAQRMLEELGNH